MRLVEAISDVLERASRKESVLINRFGQRLMIPTVLFILIPREGFVTQTPF